MAGPDKKSEDENNKLLAENRKARFNYAILETFEAGLVLKGTEVKACRAGKANLTDGYAAVRTGELYLQNVHIGEYSHGNRSNHEPRRARKLLLNRRELDKIDMSLKSGQSFVPLKMYVKDSLIKVLMGLATGKKTHDKRHDIKKREADREMDRARKTR